MLSILRPLPAARTLRVTFAGLVAAAGGLPLIAALETGRPLFHPFVQTDEPVTAFALDGRGVAYTAAFGRISEHTPLAPREHPVAAESAYLGGLEADAAGRLHYMTTRQIGWIDPRATLPATPHWLPDLPKSEWSRSHNFTHLAVHPDGVFASSQYFVARWRDGRWRVWPLGDRFPAVLRLGGATYVSQAGEPLFRVTAAGLEPVVTGKVIRDARIITGRETDNGEWLLLNKDGRLLRARPGGEAHYVSESPITSLGTAISPPGAFLSGGALALATPAGLELFDAQGRFLTRLDNDSGLPTRTINRVRQPDNGPAWFTTLNEVYRLDFGPGVTRFARTEGLGNATVLTLARHEGTLYAGTTEGVFRLVPGEAAARRPAVFQAVPGINHRVPSLQGHRGTLLAAGGDGVYALSPAGFTRILHSTQSVHLLAPSRTNPRQVFFASSQNLNTLTLTDTGWQTSPLGVMTRVDPRTLIETPTGEIWIAGHDRMLDRLRPDSAPPSDAAAIGHFSKLTPEEASGAQRSYSRRVIPMPHQYRPAWWDGQLILTGPDGAVTLSGDDPALRPRALADAGAPPAGQRWVLARFQDDHAWIAARAQRPGAGIQLFRLGPNPEGQALRISSAVTAAAGEITTLFEDISDGVRVLWIAGTAGLVRCELAAIPTPAPAPAVILHTLIATDGKGGHQQPLDAPLAPLPPTDELRVSFAAPWHESGGPIHYQTRIDGLLARWSDPTPEPQQTLARPPAGEFTFRVRAITPDGLIGPEASFAFSVLPPWWRTGWALTGGIILGLGGVAGLFRWRHRALRQRSAQLASLVAQRTAELQAREHQLVEARDAAEAANRAKSVFLASMSHELRTPLNAILGYAQLLRHTPGLPAESRRQLSTVHASGEHLLTMINDVLDLAKIEAGKVELHARPFPLSQLLTHLSEVFEPRAAQKGIAFSQINETPLPAIVTGDEGRLRQVLYNLLGNALKFTEQGRVELRAGVFAGRLRFTVSDTGIGIAAAEQAAIFKLFHQAVTPLAAQGTGLGLAISQRLVRLMGGEIAVESAAGTGSRFTFAVPLPMTPAPILPPAEIERLPTGYRGPRRRVLIVDDEPVNRDILRSLLAPLGFIIEEAGDGEAALARVAAHAPDVILMDIRLPRLDGLAATRRLRNTPGGDALRIIAISASVYPVDRTEAIAAGCDDFEPKPVRTGALLATLARVLGLEWEYAPAPAAAPLVFPEELPAAWTLPAAELLRQLDEQVELGDLVALRAILAGARPQTPAARPFIDALDSFAAHARLATLRRWLAAALARSSSP